jgi:hypothetical protein
MPQIAKKWKEAGTATQQLTQKQPPNLQTRKLTRKQPKSNSTTAPKATSKHQQQPKSNSLNDPKFRTNADSVQMPRQ